MHEHGMICLPEDRVVPEETVRAPEAQPPRRLHIPGSGNPL